MHGVRSRPIGGYPHFYYLFLPYLSNFNQRMIRIYASILFALLPCLVLAQNQLKWDYPIKPGTEAWKALKNPAERQAACQMDASLLKSLPTEDLIYICMEHPFFRSYVVYDSPTEGLQWSIGKFNGYSELVSRPDAMKSLAKVYQKEDFGKMKTLADSAQMGAYSLKWIGLELMMTDDRLLNQLSAQEKAKFLKEYYGKYLEKQQYKEVFGGIAKSTTALTAHKLLKSLDYKVLKNIDKWQSADLFETRLIVREKGLIDDLLANLADFVQKN